MPCLELNMPPAELNMIAIALSVAQPGRWMTSVTIALISGVTRSEPTGKKPSGNHVTVAAVGLRSVRLLSVVERTVGIALAS
eukprot:COSAG06_NODE_53367_length_300_cov_1.029851_1_plen_81_part_10